MQGLADAFWRAAAYCLMPRVIALSLLPLLASGLLAFGFMFFSGRTPMPAFGPRWRAGISSRACCSGWTVSGCRPSAVR